MWKCHKKPQDKLPTSGPLSYLHSSALKTWTSYWKREGFAGMDMWNTPMVQSRQPLTCRLLESLGLGSPRWLGSSWQRGIAESGSSQLSTLMIETPGDLVWDLPCVQQASYLEGVPLLWILFLYLHVNKKSDYIWYDCWHFNICKQEKWQSKLTWALKMLNFLICLFLWAFRILCSTELSTKNFL